MTGGQVERDDTQSFGINGRLELGPVVSGEAGEPIDRLDQQYVAFAGVLEQAQQLRLIRGGAAGVLQVLVGDDLVLVGSELLQRGTGSPGER